MGVLGAELDVLAAGIGHGKGQGQGLELLRCGLVVPNVHQARNKILINLEKKKTEKITAGNLN